MNYGPTRIIQNWQPEHLEEKLIKVGLIAEIEKHLGQFKCAYWTLRGPGYKSPPTNTRWHTDGTEDIHSIVWSNILPTEFEGDFQAGPGDIILVRNLDFRHRTPNIGNSERWFMQFYEISPATRTKLGKWFR